MSADDVNQIFLGVEVRIWDERTKFGAFSCTGSTRKKWPNVEKKKNNKNNNNNESDQEQ